MDAKEFTSLRKSVFTPYGEIAYVEKGSGPDAALFVHGVLLNGYLWRDSIDALSGTRRCIALDLMGHGATKTPADADMSFDAQVAMIGSFLDALGIDEVDLVANDSGGGIAQIFAAENPQRIRSLVLTNSDTHDNYPPPGL
jgi:pimeloyl-ACP methyl ester carboxylesterase